MSLFRLQHLQPIANCCTQFSKAKLQCKRDYNGISNKQISTCAATTHHFHKKCLATDCMEHVATIGRFRIFLGTTKMKSVGLLLLGITVGLLGFYWRDTFDPDSLSGARVVVTGASTGIGEQMAYHYARFGAQIVLTARREAELRKVMVKCLELGAKKVFYFPADMASPLEPEKLVQFTLQHLGGLDYVVLNHYSQNRLQMWDGDINRIQRTMQVNFFSYLSIASAALPALTESKGSLVVVSSFLGRVAAPMLTPYIASKFALEGFFATLRHELIMQKKDVSITVCVLGFIDTETSLENARGIVSLPPAPAFDAALAIVKGGATRAMEVFYPRSIEFLALIQYWFPQQRDMFIRYIYNYTSV